MPQFRVEALERFVVRMVYFVEARAPTEAEVLCDSGRVADVGLATYSVASASRPA